MTDDGTDALEQALALHATPSILPMLRERPLPRAVLLLIRIAAGDSEAVTSTTARTSETRQVVTDAAVLYIQQVMLHGTADSYRLLGARPESGDETIKENYRWLMRWLHPDRHPERWEVVYSERVNRAWNSLNSEQRRRDYDAQAVALATDWDADIPIKPMRIAKHQGVPGPQLLLSPNAVRKLPMLVLGGMAILASISLALLYWVQHDQRAAINAPPDALASKVPLDDSSAQEAAIQRNMAFDEHAIELSQPGAPASVALPVSAEIAPVVTTTPMAVESTVAEPTTLASAPPAPMPVRTSKILTATVPGDVPAVAVLPMRDAIPDPVPVHAAAPLPRTVGSAMPKPAIMVMPTFSPPPSTARPLQQATMTVVASAKTRTSASAARSQMRDPAAETSNAEIASAQEAAIALPRDFASAYAKGDLLRIMRLFTPDAVNNRGGIAAIAEDYDHLFHDSTLHELRLDDLEWVVHADRIVGSGTFDARIRHNDELSARSVQGWIQIEAVPINGRWRIQRILHRNSE